MENIKVSRDELISIIQNEIMTPSEASEYLGVSKQRLSDMNRQGKLIAIKKGIYLKQDVEERKNLQEDLRKKYSPNKK